MNHRIPELLNRPWAITADKFATMLEVYDRHAAGEKFDVEGLRAAASDRMSAAAEDSGYTVESGVAIIPIDGVLSKRMNLFSVYSGGTSTQILAETIQQAAADPHVTALVLSIDSPGGEVDGTQVAANAVAAVTKPVVAWLDGQCCSGAYWIASQANERYISDRTTVVGSIGVVITHTDRSKANEQAGKKVTEITAGKYKRIASAHQPLAQDGRDVLQGQADQIYSVFVDDVAVGLGVTADNVVENMADGKIFIGQQAIDAGLANGVASLDDLISKFAQPLPSTLPAPAPRLQLPSAAKPQRRSGTLGILDLAEAAEAVRVQEIINSPITQQQREEAMAYKSFASEAEYNAEIAAAEARGKAVAPVSHEGSPDNKGGYHSAAAEQANVRAQQDGIAEGRKLSVYLAQQRAAGRRMTSAQAQREMDALAAA